MKASQFLACASLISAMQQALEESRGVKIFVPEAQVPKLKRMFYQCRAYEPSFEPLSLLATANPSTFLIYHEPEKEIPNGYRMEETKPET